MGKRRKCTYIAQLQFCRVYRCNHRAWHLDSSPRCRTHVDRRHVLFREREAAFTQSVTHLMTWFV